MKKGARQQGGWGAFWIIVIFAIPLVYFMIANSTESPIKIPNFDLAGLFNQIQTWVIANPNPSLVVAFGIAAIILIILIIYWAKPKV